MPLFVPILRLLMLFLNVYDSYKTLKDPSPSTRNGGRPSVRAMSQRKRDMKGCLAVWIVWTSLAIYERTLENIVCLFIPFYDEFKSLVLLFLILTRARGAEPIYLHVIRPFLKPYTRTLDATLEIMLMFGDFTFALSTYPLRLGLRWWQRHFGKYYEPFETEADSQSELSSNEVNTSELPSSFLVSSGPAPTPLPAEPPESSTRQFPNKPFGGTRTTVSQSRRPSQDIPSGDTTQTADAHGINQAGPSRSQHRKNSRSENGVSDSSLSKPSRQPQQDSQAAKSHHQVWYPPQAAYADEDLEDAQVNLTIKPSQPSEPHNEANHNEVQSLEQQQLDEWRQYPPFPSAYPPTPITATARLIPTSMAVPSSLYPPIEEEKVQQDFCQSLLPPREPLNPTHAGDLSDRSTTFGIHHYLGNQSLSKGADDSMSTSDDYDYEDEDDFNITLRTPLPPQGSARSQMPARRLVSLASASSAASGPSRSSALTTVDSLRTQTSSDSSLSAPGPAMLSSTIIGKKRSYPRTRPLSTKNRVRQVEDEGSEEDYEDLPDPQRQRMTPSRLPPTRKLTSDTIRPVASASDTADDLIAPSSVSSRSETGEQGEQEPVPPEEKRRKVVRSQHPRAVTASRPVRPRVSRYASPPPKQALNARALEKPAASKSKTGSVSLKPASRVNSHSKEKPATSSDASSPASGSGSRIPTAQGSVKPSSRAITRR